MKSPKRSSATQWPSVRSWSWICKRTSSLTAVLCNMSSSWRPDGTGGPERGRRETKEETAKEPKRFTTQEMARRFSPALLCHPWWEKKSFYPDITWLFFQDVDRTESSKEPEPEPSTTGMSDIAACPPSHTASDPSALPPPTSSPSSSQYLFLPVHSMPAVVVHYCNFQSTVLYDENGFILYVFKCIICVKSIINLLQYSTIQLIVLVGYPC